MNTLRISACLVAIALASGCSARPERFVDPVENPEPQVRVTSPTEKGIAEFKDLEFIEGEPEVVNLGTMGMTQAFRVGDVTVIHRATPANSVVAANLYIVGGSQNLTMVTSGIEQLATSVATQGGVEGMSKDAFNAKLDSMGAEIFNFTDRDYSGYGFKTVVDNFDATWDLFTQAVMSPAMPDDVVELRKTQQLATISQMLEDPDRHVSYIAARKFSKTTPTSICRPARPNPVASFTREDLRAYQREMLRPERMLLVVVGNVSASDVVNRLKASFGRLKASGQDLKPLPNFSSKPGVTFADRDLPTNYILGYFEAPSPGSPEYPAMLVAVEYLRDRLFEEVRTKRNLTYAVASGLSEKKTNFGYLYVTATDPQTTMGVIFDQIEEMKLIQISKTELDEVINVYLTNHYMGLETNGGQANMLALAQITSGDWRMAEAFLAEIRAVTPEDVQNAARKYLQNYRFGVVGPRAALNESMFTP
ncbi:MAG: pitrilysin family protein [bacterium]